LIARQPPEAQAIIRLLLAKIDELEAKYRRTPDNSSLPPSSQHLHAKSQRAKKKAKRKRGGQRGHKKYERQLIPTEECDDVISLRICAELSCTNPKHDIRLPKGRNPYPVPIDTKGSQNNKLIKSETDSIEIMGSVLYYSAPMILPFTSAAFGIRHRDYPC